jgi:hypothetical protein
MAGRSRPKDGVASLAYVPAIHDFNRGSKVARHPQTGLRSLRKLDCVAGMTR